MQKKKVDNCESPKHSFPRKQLKLDLQANSQNNFEEIKQNNNYVMRTNYVKVFPNSAKNQRQAQVNKYDSQQFYFKNKDSNYKPDFKSPSQLTPTQARSQEGFKRQNQRVRTELSQYDKLHQKLNFIETRISQMKSNLQKKRQQKRKKFQENLKKNQINEQKQLALKQEKTSLKGLVTQVPQHKQFYQTFDNDPYSPRNNTYYVSEIVKAYKVEKSLARQHLMTSLHILKVLEATKMPTKEQISDKILSLPIPQGYQGKKTVVFDLDETLIHCNESTDVPYDVKLPIKFPTGQIIEAGVNIRPNAKQILQNLSKNFEVIVFTASHSCYANVVLDYLDPTNQYIHHRLYRQHCYQTPQGVYIKDLRVINRSLADMVLVDNAAYSYVFQLDNGIPIIPYYHGTKDFQLKTLQKYIQQMVFCKDVRQINKKTFKLHKYRNYYHDPEKLVKELYLEIN